MSHKPIYSNSIWNTFNSKIILGISARESNEYMQLLGNKVSTLAPVRKSRSSFHCPSEFGNFYYYQDKEIMNGGGEQDDDNKTSNDQHQHQHLLQLLPISVQNKIDLGELLISQYHLSNLSLKEFISSSKLLAEICEHRHIDTAQKTLVESMLINYIKAYSKYIEEPIPNSRNEFSRNFKFFDDKIDIILAYLSKINQFIGQYGLNQTRPLQFDVYFASPSAHNDFDNLLSAESMVKSVPTKRFHPAASGLDEIHSFLGSKSAQRLLGFGQSGRECRKNSRLILLIIRKNERNTNKDSLYLLKQNVNDDMYSNPVYEYNEFLWKLNTKQVFFNSKLNVNDSQCGTQDNLFCLSYHLRPNKACKKYFYFNGYGEQICKRHLINKMPLLFEDKDNKNQISNDILDEYQYGDFKDYIDENDDHFQFGKYLFGLTYSVKALGKRSRQQIITFPKNILQNKLNQIAEFHEQSQLYYYLTWTHKMQLVDNLFLGYAFTDGCSQDIAIFNTELHDKTTQHELFAVAVPNDRVHGNRRNVPKWKMNHFMDAQQIKQVYGINASHLPQGSRSLRGYFQHEIHENTHSLSPHIDVQNWRNVETIRSQQFKHRYTPRFNRSELNTAIKHSIGKIQRSELELVPILNIDIKNEEIRVDSLIPIQIKNQWIAVSFKKLPIRPFKTVVTGLYIDCDDIINKASLVDPKALQTFQWLKYSPFDTRKSFNHYHNHQQYKPSVSAVNHHQNHQNDQNDSSLPSMETERSVQSTGSLQSSQSIQSMQTNPTMLSTPNSTANSVANTDNSLDLGRQLNDALRGNNVMAAMLRQKDDIISQQSQQIQRLNQQLQAMQQTVQRLNQQMQQQHHQQPSSAKVLPGNIMIPSIPSICTNSPLPSAPNSAAFNYNLNMTFPPILPVPPSVFVDILTTSRPGSRPGSPVVPTLNLAYNSPPVTPPMPMNVPSSAANTANWTGTQINAGNNCSITIGRTNNGQNYQ